MGLSTNLALCIWPVIHPARQQPCLPFPVFIERQYRRYAIMVDTHGFLGRDILNFGTQRHSAKRTGDDARITLDTNVLKTILAIAVDKMHVSATAVPHEVRSQIFCHIPS